MLHSRLPYVAFLSFLAACGSNSSGDHPNGAAAGSGAGATAGTPGTGGAPADDAGRQGTDGGSSGRADSSGGATAGSPARGGSGGTASGAGGMNTSGGASDGGGAGGEPACTPDCGSAVCGSDGCNGVCGTCDPTKLCEDGQCVAPSGTADVSVATKTSLHAIHPEIYGLAFASKAQLAELNVPLNRSGGNSTTRYNWQLDVHNVGADWFFENIADTGEGTYGQPGYLSTSDVFVRDTLGAGATPLVTIPTIGFTPKSRKTDHPYDCGYPKTEYSDQCCGPNGGGFDPYDTNCGSGKNSQGNITATTDDALNTSAAVGPDDATARVKHIVDTYGSAYGERTHFYQLDNEMLAWSGTHADVHPGKVTYDEVWQKTADFAPAVRASDPDAFVMGYGTFSTGDVIDSMTSGDKQAHGDVPLMRFYLQHLAQYEKDHGTRLVDCVDIHPYPQSGTPPLDSPRDLWDPTYKDPTWINDLYGEPVRLLPRLREWIAEDYPGTGVCLTEYTFFPDDAHGALIQADVLGIFGREDVRLAAFWTVPWDKDTPTAPYWAFRMYRNYDGAGSAFGEQALGVATSVANLSAYAAERASDHAITVMLVNESDSMRSLTVSLDGSSAASAGVFTYVSGAESIDQGDALGVAAGEVTTTVPAYAIQLLVAK
jgi:hypothetical protein